MRARSRRPRLAVVFAVLMLVSAILTVTPPAWTRWMAGVLQPIGWVQWLLLGGSRRAAESMGEGRISPRETELIEQIQRLSRQVIHQGVLLARLEEQLRTVSGMREALGGRPARVVPAAVVSVDPSPLRDAITIAAGSVHGVRVGDWVAAGMPRDQVPEGVGGHPLLRQWLVGRVASVQPYLSRVQLASDRGFERVLVRAARGRPDGTWQLSDQECLLYGRGEGRMEIRDATVDYAAKGYTFVVAPLGAAPAVSLLLGRIESSEKLLGAPLHCHIHVRPMGPAKWLSQVYVICAGE